MVMGQGERRGGETIALTPTDARLMRIAVNLREKATKWSGEAERTENPMMSSHYSMLSVALQEVVNAIHAEYKDLPE